jgi:hypothetical protein
VALGNFKRWLLGTLGGDSSQPKEGKLSYILRGLLRAANPTYKKGHSLTIYISLFCWSLLLRQGIYLLKYFLLVYGC